MITAHLVFHPDLPFFLSPSHKTGVVEVTFRPGQSIKHLVESLGLPHTEIGAVRVNNLPSNLAALTNDGDQVHVFAASATFGPRPAELRFVLDNHLGRLAADLRMLGFDSLYRNDFQDEELARVAAQEERILLTRDRRLLMRKPVVFGYCPRSLNSREQLREVMARYNLAAQIEAFKRCLRCNGLLKPVEKAEIIDRLEPLTKQYFEEFRICPDCQQVYWKGSHYEEMKLRIEGMV